MSQWGKLDRINLGGVVATANLNSATVTTTTSAFVTANVKVGDALLIENVAYRVNQVTNSNTIVLDVAFTSANSAALTLGVQQSPKELTTFGWGNAAVGLWNSKRNVYGVDRTEVGLTVNKANCFSHTGWTRYERYTSSNGSVRNKSEVLVAMSKNFNANDAGTLQTDANDNTVLKNS